MPILINLLPDVRQAKLRESRRRQLVTGVSIMVWVICGSAVLLMSLYAGGQKVIINNYTHDISVQEAQLENVPGIVAAYTAQQHLAALPQLYSQRVYMTRFLQAYTEADPTTIALTALSLDASGALIVQGNSDTYASVAKLARALTASNVTVGTGAQSANVPYFSNVSIVTAGSGNGSKGVNFTINATVASGATSAGQ